jgi:hypothetical protein
MSKAKRNGLWILAILSVAMGCGCLSYSEEPVQELTAEDLQKSLIGIDWSAFDPAPVQELTARDFEKYWTIQLD